jgi:hypothetical protein
MLGGSNTVVVARSATAVSIVLETVIVIVSEVTCDAGGIVEEEGRSSVVGAGAGASVASKG